MELAFHRNHARSLPLHQLATMGRVSLPALTDERSNTYSGVPSAGGEASSGPFSLAAGGAVEAGQVGDGIYSAAEADGLPASVPTHSSCYQHTTVYCECHRPIRD